MAKGVKPENPKISPDAKRANKEIGYGPNNPEPIVYHLRDNDDAPEASKNHASNALHAAEEYIYGKE